jgi:hypothetical protein
LCACGFSSKNQIYVCEFSFSKSNVAPSPFFPWVRHWIQLPYLSKQLLLPQFHRLGCLAAFIFVVGGPAQVVKFQLASQEVVEGF